MQANLTITQNYLIEELRDALGASEETENLLDNVMDAWETFRVLRNRFGETAAFHILTAYAFYPLIGGETCTTKPNGERNGPTDQEQSASGPLMDLQAVR